MIWSKFNILFTSSDKELLLYNSRTNSFLKLNNDLYLELKKIETGEKNISELPEDIINELKKRKIVISKTEDSSFINQMLYLKRKKSFSNNNLELIVAPTLACNFACPYCYESNLPGSVMKENIQDNLISFINSHQSSVDKMSLSWHGGEPLIAFDAMKSIISKIMEKSSIKMTEHRMVSNGYLFNKEMIHFFKETSLSYLQITIDGGKDTHNKTRIHKNGLPTYDIILSNIDLISSELTDCKIGIRVNIQNENKDEYPQIFGELNERWKNNPNCFIYPAIVLKQGSCSVTCLSGKERAEFYIGLYKKHNLNVDFTPALRLGSCDGIYENSYIVDPQGYLYKCWADIGMEQRSVGNLIDGVTKWEFVAEYMMGSDKFTDKKCLNCNVFPVCDGGCNRFRIEEKYKNIPYDICPVDNIGVRKYLEIIYDNNKSHI